MSSLDSHQPLLPSLLDRLLDDDPGQTTEPLWRGSFRVEDLRRQLQRDLEDLLNTRHARMDLLETPCELGVSTLTYGLLDQTGLIGSGGEVIERMRTAVERTVRAYEPRLRDVAVTISGREEFDRNIHLTIRAVLCVDPIVEPVTFDTTLETSTGGCDVKLA
ncbi:MAG TPA: type VI secretion system baseplate subunit TssE [Planctomycetaceae bacterium]|nr:type VI secretion system baseplate subunit TssE [Planctomycetaceae bacterium]